MCGAKELPKRGHERQCMQLQNVGPPGRILASKLCIAACIFLVYRLLICISCTCPGLESFQNSPETIISKKVELKMSQGHAKR